MPAAGSVNNGNYNFWVTGEDYNGYCNPGEVGVDAQIYKPIILNNCQGITTTTISSSITTTIITNPIYAGFRSSPYGYQTQQSPSWWVSMTKGMSAKVPNSAPTIIWILGEIMTPDQPKVCKLYFPSPGGTYQNIIFNSNDVAEQYLNTFDANGIKVWLQVEPGDADVSQLIDLVLGRYSHHSSVIGFGVDVEWYKYSTYNNVDSPGKPITDTEAQTWLNKVKSYNSNYKLFLKHWLTGKIPPTFRNADLVFIDDSEDNGNLQNMINDFKFWGNAFSSSNVGFQFGYPSDKSWWSQLSDPLGQISNTLISNIPNTKGVYWVDFSIQDIFPTTITTSVKSSTTTSITVTSSISPSNCDSTCKAQSFASGTCRSLSNTLATKLHIEGKDIKNDYGQTIYLRGFNILGHFHDAQSGYWGKWNYYNTTVVDKVLDKMKSYGVNYIREFTNTESWINNSVVNSNIPNLKWRDMIKDFISRCESRGIYVTLTDYTVKPGKYNDQDIGGYPPYCTSDECDLLPTKADFINYATNRVVELGQYDNYIAEFWNEPYNFTSGDVKEWQGVWQQITNNVRAKGYKGLILAQYSFGLGTWGNPSDNFRNLNWYYYYPLNDPLNNTIVSFHKYAGDVPTMYSALKQVYDTTFHVRDISLKIPVMAGEIGARLGSANESEFLNNSLKIFNEWGISYSIWSYSDETSWSWSTLKTETLFATGGDLNANGQIAVDAIKAGGATSTCQSAETSIGQDGCSSGLCCCSGNAQKCSDGTTYGSCNATNKPKYCNSGTLIDKCSQCGCSSGTCQVDGTCKIGTQACSIVTSFSTGRQYAHFYDPYNQGYPSKATNPPFKYVTNQIFSSLTPSGDLICRHASCAVDDWGDRGADWTGVENVLTKMKVWGAYPVLRIWLANLDMSDQEWMTTRRDGNVDGNPPISLPNPQPKITYDALVKFLTKLEALTEKVGYDNIIFVPAWEFNQQNVGITNRWGVGGSYRNWYITPQAYEEFISNLTKARDAVAPRIRIGIAVDGGAGDIPCTSNPNWNTIWNSNKQEWFDPYIQGFSKLNYSFDVFGMTYYPRADAGNSCLTQNYISSYLGENYTGKIVSYLGLQDKNFIIYEYNTMGPQQIRADSDFIQKTYNGIKNAINQKIVNYEALCWYYAPQQQAYSTFNQLAQQYYNYPLNSCINNQPSSPASNLVGYWSFDDCTVKDSSGLGSDGTSYGTACIGGHSGNAFNFSGANNYVQIPGSSSLSGFTALTVSFWINPRDSNRRQAILNKYNNVNGSKGWFIDTPSYGGNYIGFFASPDGSNYVQWTVPFVPILNSWYHIAVVWQANKVPTFYINGQQVSTTDTAIISSIYNNVGVPLLIGKSQYATGREFNGTIDEVKIWNRALSAGEILNEYTSIQSTINYAQLVPTLRGVNYQPRLLAGTERGCSSPPCYSSIKPPSNQVFNNISSYGFNFVRIPFYWESYYMNPTGFLDEAENVAKAANDSKIYVLFDSHQYNTSSYFYGSSYTAGFPSYLLTTYPNNAQGEQQFWRDFYNNTLTYGGKTVWELYADFYSQVIARVDKYDSVIGYEILNEPPVYDDSQYQKLGNFHTYVAKRIRTVSNKAIFFERAYPVPGSYSSINWTLSRNIAPIDVDNIVFAPHRYTAWYSGMFNNFKSLAVYWGGIPVLIGEWSENNEGNMSVYVSELKNSSFGWSYWMWTYGSGTTGQYLVNSSWKDLSIYGQWLVNAMNRYYGICKSSVLPAPIQFTLIPNSRDGTSGKSFHTHNELITMFKTLYDKYPGYASYEPVGKTYEGRDIVLFKIGNPNGGKVLWDGAVHGWEDAGSEVEYLIAKWLLENGTTGIDPTAKKIIEQNLILFVPVVNMDSYERQNRNSTGCSYGVDLNRNFVKGWTAKSCLAGSCMTNANCSTNYVCKNNVCTNNYDYSGSSGGSEKETQALRNVFQTYKPNFYVNVHYGGGPLLYYYSGSGSNVTLSNLILQRIRQLDSQMGVIPYPTSAVGSNGETVGDASNYANAWLLEIEENDPTCSRYSHTCPYSDVVNKYYPKAFPIFLAMTEASGNSTASVCQSGETVQTCSCGSWTNGNCGAGGCSSTQRQQARICIPTGCTPTDGLGTSRCIADTSCVSTAQSQVNVDMSKTIGTNKLRIGTQTDYGSTIAINTLRQNLMKNVSIALVRSFDWYIGYPNSQACTSWNDATKTGTFNWQYVDQFVDSVFNAGAEPMIALGFADTGGNGIAHLPNGMGYNSTTLLPNPDEFASYASYWVNHFASTGRPVRFYQIVNEPFMYLGWTPNSARLAYYASLYNRTYNAMKALNSNLIISQDFDAQQTVLDYFINNNVKIDAIDYHKYDSGTANTSSSNYETDSKLFKDAETQYFTNGNPFTRSVSNAQAYYQTKTGRNVIIINSEGNLNSAWNGGTDSRNVMMNGAVWDALKIRMEILNNVSYDVHFTFMGSKSYETSKKPFGGYGFGMIDSDSNKPYYPYWLYHMIFNNLKVGDKLYSSSSSSSNIRTLAWIDGSTNNILIIHNSTTTDTIRVTGFSGALKYSKIDNSISFLNSAIQAGTIDASNIITLNGYTVMLLQQSIGQTTTTISTTSTSIATTTIKTTTTTIQSSTTTIPIITTGMLTGINYLSNGNKWAESNSILDADFSRFANDGIKHISVRIMWSVMEPSHSDISTNLDPTALSNIERVLTEANKYGIKLNLDFWSQHGYTLGLPTWVGSYWDIEAIPEIRNHYVRYMQTVVNQLKYYPAIESWTVLNEPWFGTASNGQPSGKTEFQATFPILYNAIKSVDPNHIVTCRFGLGYTPGSGKYDASVYDVFDVFAVTEYLDPSNPSDTRYNSKWSYWDKTIIDLKARNKPLWVIEFGNDNADAEHMRLYYEQSLQKFNAEGIVQRAYAWVWQTGNAGAEVFNIYNGTNPKPAYFELKMQQTTTTTIKPLPTTIATTTVATTSAITTIPSSYTDLTCSGSTSHYCSLNYKSIDSVDSITVPSSARCGDTIPVTVYWTGRHNTNENHWGFFLETVSSSPSTYLYYLSNCKSYIADSGTNSYKMSFNVKMPAAGSVNNGNYNFWVTGEDYNGYCNPGEVGVDAQKYKIITLSNC
jgi:hypothetical protein